MTGFFATFEGGEGSGKSTQILRLAAHLRTLGFDVVTTREPGGSEGAEALRHVLLSGAVRGLGGSELEALLFAAARIDHIDTTIKPTLDRGGIVLCDRFHDSTRVYQGLDGTPAAMIDNLERIALGELRPDLTIILDLPARTGLERAARRRGASIADRFERDAIDVHEARRRRFLDIAAAEPQRCVVVDGSKTVDSIADEIRFIVDDRLDSRSLEGRAPLGAFST